VRLYLPATLAEVDARPAPLAPRPAHAVTPDLRAAFPEEDEEGWEFVAQSAAAEDSVRRQGAEDVPLRLVLVAEVPAAHVRPAAGGEASAVELAAEVSWDDVVCLLVDEPEAAAEVRAAREGEAGALAALEERDLLWYDVTEAGDVPRP